MTLYAAVGKYELRKNDNGEKVPYVIAGNQAHELDLWEMILWSSLIWKICTYDETSAAFYAKEREAHVLGDHSVDYYISSMEQRGLIAAGHGITGMDALRYLLQGLCAIPVTADMLSRAAAFIHLTFVERIPLEVTRKIFVMDKFSKTEKQLIRLMKNGIILTDELVRLSCRNQEAIGVYTAIADLYLNKHIIFDKQY